MWSNRQTISPFDYATDGPTVDCLKSNNVHTASVEAQAADPRQGGFPSYSPTRGWALRSRFEPLSLSTFQHPAGSPSTVRNYIDHTITLYLQPQLKRRTCNNRLT